MDTELERMVIRLMGDIGDFEKDFKVVDQAIDNVQKDFNDLGKTANQDMKSLGDSSKEASNTASSGFGTIKSGAKSLLASLGPIAVALTGIAGIAGFAGITSSAYESIDALAKTSDKLGIATEDLARMRFAANQSGVASEVMDKSLGSLSRKMQEAAKNGGPVADTLKSIGLSADELKNKSPVDAFKDITKAMEGVEGQNKKTAIAFQLFEEEGTALVNTMAGGLDGLNAKLAEAEELGIGPSREDAAKIEAANDAWDVMKATFSELTNTLAIELAPMFISVAEVGKNVGLFASKSFKAMMPIVHQVINVFGAMWNTLTGMIQSVFDFGSTWDFVYSIVQTVFDFVIDSLILAEFAWLNMGSIGELAFLKVQLAGLQFFEEMSHFFTKVLPGYLNWFLTNWTQIWSEAGEFASTVVSNLANNVKAGHQKTVNALASFTVQAMGWIQGQSQQQIQDTLDTLGEMQDMQKKFDFKGLADGFESKITLPEIPERELGEYEKDLLKQVSDMENTLTDSLGDFMTKRKADLVDEAGKIAKEINSALGEESKAMQNSERKIDLGLTAEQQNAITIQGDGNDPNQKTADNTKIIADETKKQTDFIRDTRDDNRKMVTFFSNQTATQIP